MTRVMRGLELEVDAEVAGLLCDAAAVGLWIGSADFVAGGDILI